MAVNVGVFLVGWDFFSMYLEVGKRLPTLPVSLVSLGQQSCFSKHRYLSLALPRLVSKLQGLTGDPCTHNWGARPGLGFGMLLMLVGG